MKLDQTEEANRLLLTIAGKCTVEHATDLRDALLAATKTDKELALDLSEVEDTDITLLQLLLATAQTLEKHGVRLVRSGPLSQAVIEAARVSGFDQTTRLKNFFADKELPPSPQVA